MALFHNSLHNDTVTMNDGQWIHSSVAIRFPRSLYRTRDIIRSIKIVNNPRIITVEIKSNRAPVCYIHSFISWISAGQIVRFFLLAIRETIPMAKTRYWILTARLTENKIIAHVMLTDHSQKLKNWKVLRIIRCTYISYSILKAS